MQESQIEVQAMNTPMADPTKNPQLAAQLEQEQPQ